MMAAILASVNYLGVAVAAIAAWLFGAAYYGALGNAWVAAQGKTAESFKQERAAKTGFAAAAPFLLSFVAEIVMACMLFGILIHMGMFGVRAGVISGALCWFGFVLPAVAVNYAFSGRNAMLTVIDAGHWLGVLVIMGGILGWMGR